MNGSRPVVPQQPKWHGRLAARFLHAGLRAIGSTWRVEMKGPSAALADSLTEPVLFAIWHNRLGVVVPFWARVRRKQTHLKLAAMVSASRDGGLLADLLQRFAIHPVRGSSSRRGPQALREAVTLVENGYCVAITPDGPRGPKYQVQPGIVALAQLTQRPIVPAGAHIAWKKTLRSWDAFQIPLPFTPCELILGRPIFVPREATADGRERQRAELERALLEINRD